MGAVLFVMSLNSEELAVVGRLAGLFDDARLYLLERTFPSRGIALMGLLGSCLHAVGLERMEATHVIHQCTKAFMP